jgi:hypothetical protein
MLTLRVSKTEVFFCFMKMNMVVTDLSAFQHPSAPKVDTATLGPVSDFCPFLGLTSFFDVLVCLLLGSFKIFYLLRMSEMLWLLNRS